MNNYTTLSRYIDSVKAESDQISAARKKNLLQLSDFVTTQLKENGIANLIFICTHNSRRSHLSQVWAQVAAHHYGIKNVFSYSGGTEATALFPSAAKALEDAGLHITKLAETNNPVYSIKYAENEVPLIGFSKRFDNDFNPKNGYAAIMTCTHADQNCPFIPDAAKRISLPYEDPKAFDNTPQQEEKYAERCRDIARELLFVFSKIA